jgi:hypothetical protein
VKKVPIHVWGGFGSQLFAVLLKYDIEHHKGISSKLIFHTSGVTARRPEILRCFPDLDCETLDDFSIRHSSSITQRSNNLLRQKFKESIKSTLERSTFFATCNTDSDFGKLNRHFLKQVRGHYSYRTVQKETLEKMNQVIPSSESKLISSQTLETNALGIHFRLGDLLTLENKKPLDTTRINNLISKILDNYKFEGIKLSSDSLLEATKILSPHQNQHIGTLEGSAMEVLAELQTAKLFVGTNSKLSLWIAILRIYFQTNKFSYLPDELKIHLRHNIDSCLVKKYILFY